MVSDIMLVTGIVDALKTVANGTENVINAATIPQIKATFHCLPSIRPTRKPIAVKAITYNRCWLKGKFRGK